MLHIVTIILLLLPAKLTIMKISSKLCRVLFILLLLTISTLSYSQNIRKDSTNRIVLNQSAFDSKESNQNQLLLYLIIALSLGLMTLVYREYKLKKLANTDLSLQKNEIEIQKQIVEKRNRDITDSLNYARRIQHAILKTSLRLEEFFAESFILFIPKDIVSGDFYWVKSKNDKILFAIADCRS